MALTMRGLPSDLLDAIVPPKGSITFLISASRCLIYGTSAPHNSYRQLPCSGSSLPGFDCCHHLLGDGTGAFRRLSIVDVGGSLAGSFSVLTHVCQSATQHSFFPPAPMLQILPAHVASFWKHLLHLSSAIRIGPVILQNLES